MKNAWLDEFQAGIKKETTTSDMWILLYWQKQRGTKSLLMRVKGES